MNPINGEVVEVIYGREPWQAMDPKYYPDDGFDYAVVKIPRGLLTKFEGDVSMRFSANCRPQLKMEVQ
jgi:hypothetical protein